MSKIILLIPLSPRGPSQIHYFLALIFSDALFSPILSFQNLANHQNGRIINLFGIQDESFAVGEWQWLSMKLFVKPDFRNTFMYILGCGTKQICQTCFMPLRVSSLLFISQQHQPSMFSACTSFSVPVNSSYSFSVGLIEAWSKTNNSNFE